MLQLQNTTPFPASISVLPDIEGIDTLFVIVQATFTIRASLEIAEEQIPPRLKDEYHGEAAASSLKYATDVNLGKVGTDVVLVGNAWAPDRPVEQLDVKLVVAGREKTVRVFGNRTWTRGLLGNGISAPEPFESMPLVYERAYGGSHAQPEKKRVHVEDRNPVGVGFLGARNKRDLVGQPLPNLEDPRKLLGKPGEDVVPAGFGFVAPTWLPRRSFAGTYDEAWQKSRAPYLPKDFDPRFFSAAHPDLVFQPYLQGGEPVTIVNASRQGRLDFQLPRCALQTAVRIAGTVEKPQPQLETVLLEPDESRVCLVWRSSLRCDKKALRIEEVRVELESV